jgi:hypothetical protein
VHDPARSPHESPSSPAGGHYDRRVLAPRRPLAVALSGALLAAGCGDRGGGLSADCPDGPHQVLGALARAPAPVRADGASLSGCLAKANRGGDLERIGTAYVGAAAALAQRARREPEGVAAVRLGYLVGAARRGAGSAPSIHTELVRRLEQEADGLDAASSALRRGEAAGRRTG